MSWILPTPRELPVIHNGKVRTIGELSRMKKRAAYHRAYYRLKRSGGRYKQQYTPEQKARRNELTKARYWRNPEAARAIARERMRRLAQAKRERRS